MFRRFAGAIVVVAFGLAACQKTATVEEPSRQLGLQHVVSLSPSTTELVCSVDYCASLVGRTASCNYPASASKAQIVMQGTTPDYEAIIKLKPNLIVYDKTLFSDDVVQKLNSLAVDGHTIKALGLAPKTVPEYEAALRSIAEVIGGETNASESMDKIYYAIGHQKGNAADAGTDLDTAFVEPGESFLAAGTKSFDHDLMFRCGIKLVGPESDKWDTWTPEDIVKANPKNIVTVMGGKSKLMADPRLASVAAIKSGSVFEVNDDALLRVGARLEPFVSELVPRLCKIGESKKATEGTKSNG